MAKEQISGVPETMLQTLYARAKETETGRHYVDDEKAVEIVSRMDYDFSKAEKDKTMRSGVVARTIVLDRMTETFLKENPETTVINIACGLDTRCYRMGGKYRMWYNLDLPETMAIRRRFFEETDSIKQIAASAMEESWAAAISPVSTPVLVVIEGLTMYLTERDVKEIFRILHQNFAKVTVFAEVMNPFVVSHVKEKSIEGSKAKFTWGVRSGEMLEQLVPPFRHVEEHSLTEGMQVFMPIYKFLGKIGFVRNISNKIIVMQA